MMLHSFMSRSFIHGHTPKFTVNITPRFLGHNCLRFYATSNINPQGSERGEREKSGRNTASKRDQEWNNNADKGKRSGENRYKSHVRSPRRPPILNIPSNSPPVSPMRNSEVKPKEKWSTDLEGLIHPLDLRFEYLYIVHQKLKFMASKGWLTSPTFSDESLARLNKASVMFVLTEASAELRAKGLLLDYPAEKNIDNGISFKKAEKKSKSARIPSKVPPVAKGDKVRPQMTEENVGQGKEAKAHEQGALDVETSDSAEGHKASTGAL